MGPFSYLSSSETKLLVSIVVLLAITRQANGYYTSIFSFGDSITDTGNLNTSSIDPGHLIYSLVPPYGETFFHHPTGRWSNGRLIIDFLDCREYFRRSLFLMGEIGGNDYNYPLVDKTDTVEVETLVPFVVDKISSAIKELIRLGATTFLVPGNFPIGCMPVYLTEYKSLNEEDYDPATGCINWLNKFSEFHNEQLQIEISRIQEEHPHVKIMYADYYISTMGFYRTPDNFGFGKEVLRACCGGGGPYNYNSSAKCGSSSASGCNDPSLSVSWDGEHLTEAAYKWIAKSLLEGPIDLEDLSAAI